MQQRTPARRADKTRQKPRSASSTQQRAPPPKSQLPPASAAGPRPERPTPPRSELTAGGASHGRRAAAPHAFKRGEALASSQWDGGSSAAVESLDAVMQRVADVCTSVASTSGMPSTLPTLLMSVFKHPEAHASPSRLVQVAGLCWMAYRSATATAAAATDPSTAHVRSCISDGLRLYLLTSPTSLIKTTNACLDGLEAALQQHPDNPAPFFTRLWSVIRPHLGRKTWSYEQCFEAGAALLACAEQALATTACHGAAAGPATAASSTAASRKSLLEVPPGGWASGDAVPDADSMAAAYKPSPALAPLHRAVHADVFDVVAGKLRRALAGDSWEAAGAGGSSSLGAEAAVLDGMVNGFNSSSCGGGSGGSVVPAPAFAAAAAGVEGGVPLLAMRTLAQDCGFRFPNAAQRLLLAAAAFNRHSAGTAHVYVLSGQALAATAASALEPLPLMLVARPQLAAVMSCLLQLDASCGHAWRPTPASLAALDDALACVVSVAAGLPALAVLVELRQRLGPLPPGGGPLMAAANEALVGLQLGPGLHLAAPDADGLGGFAAESPLAVTPAKPAGTAQQQAEQRLLQALCTLLQAAVQQQQQQQQQEAAAFAVASPPASIPSRKPSSRESSPASSTASPTSPTSSSSSFLPPLPPLPTPYAMMSATTASARASTSATSEGLDVGALLIKVQMALALGSDALWSSPDFLCRTYPRLVACAVQLGERPQDLLLDRYAESVAEALSLPPAQRHAAWSDMLCVADVLATFALQDDDGGTAGGTGTSGASVLLTLTGSFGEEDAAPWQQAMQAHLARLLVAGVSNGFIRQQQWLGALARVAAWRVECPQLAAALAWATVHDTQLFGRGEGLREALRHWLPLAGGRVEDGAALRAATLLGGVRAAAGSGGGRPRGRNVELPGIGSIGETRLVACLEEGQRMKLPGLPPGPEAWGDAVAARLGLASAATATAAGEAAGLTGARYLDPEEWVRAATAAAAMASVTA